MADPSLTDSLPGLRHVLRRLAPYTARNKALVAGGAGALLAGVAFKLLEPWPLKFVIDHVVTSAGGTDPMGTALDPMTLLLSCAAGLLAIVALRAAFEYLATIAFALAGSRILTEVRADLFRHLQALPLSFHTGTRTGDLTVRLISDIGMLKEAAVTALMPLAVNVLVLAGMVAVMLWLDWQLALIALLPLPILYLASLRMGRRIQGISRKVRKTEGAMAATSAEALAGIRTVQAMGLEEKVASQFGAANARSLGEGVKAKRLAAGLERSVDVLVGVSLALVLLFGARSVLDGRMTPGDLIVFITYIKNTYRPVRGYAKQAARLARATAAGERVIELLDRPVAIADRPDARAASFPNGAISLERVSFRYDSEGAPVLQDVSLDIPSGQFVAVTGPSGVGKSTLASLILRLAEPQAGALRIDGEDVRDVTLSGLRRHIAFVPQETLLLRASVAENIALASGRDVTRQEIEDAARLAEAHGFVSALPQGYDTELAERGATLSGGQRQRLAIARAALRNAPILILDEPTAGLDRKASVAVEEALIRLARGRTTILVTHDLALASRAERVVVLDRGRIAQDGAPGTLRDRPGAFADLLQTGGRSDIAAE
ncbi:ABC transporter ATP-binding protein [Jannaschia aquimarina]|uniref:Putative multidrug export ATP-binding/permease protein n=1 Tax=Jannaschia aquimarina TaxID=935700 RepID=A0A0D1EME5_9RHOB|nr:ABC transporter ATP-binding protein [Jannaschia aquimarina]KIT16850.1 putative multidrug export ATP-binding/permease protein [Jannaschia aquimarina]SNT13047.1 ATP-binding cassette, subfamily B [Jannaschia aquimarina]